MNPRLLTTLFLLGTVILVADEPPSGDPPKPSLDDAQRLLDSGEYAKALDAFTALAAVDSADVVSKVRAQLGAVESLDAVGRYGEALERAQKAIEMAPDNFPARYWVGLLQETTGQKALAIETYRWFEPRVRGNQRPANAEALTFAALGLDRLSLLTGKPSVYAKFILHELLQSVHDTIDPKYWPARLASANLLLAKYNVAQARGDFLKTLELNQRSADAEVGLARIEMEKWDSEKVESRIARALRKNPNHVGAMVTRATIMLAERKDTEAIAELNKALAVNPNDLDTLSLMAAIHTRNRDDAKASEYITRVEKINAGYGELYAVIGEWLHSKRQFKQAEKYFLRASELSPELAEPRTSLGRMYLDMGETEKARLTLDASFRIDPFHVRTFNTLNLLDRLEKFARVETEHFIVKFDKKQDAVLATYFTEYLESIYPELTKKYGYELPVKSIVEVYPSHDGIDGFAVRITGMGWLPTVGACTGRVIAMDAPRKGARLTPFDWKDVLRHEFTHVITLTQTENRIAHWFTEGLATSEQPLPLEWGMRRTFVNAVRRGKLVPIEKLDFGFMRMNERQLAYAQSEQIVEYIREKWGYEKIHTLLAAYRDGKSQAQAFQEIFSQSEKEFDGGFVEWAWKRAESWGFSMEPIREVVKIRKELETKPDDPSLLGELTESLYWDGKNDESRKTAEKCLTKDPKNTRALAIKAAFLLQQQKWDDAKPLLEQLQHIKPKSLFAANALGAIALKKNQLDDAIAQFTKLTQLCPSDPEGQKGLAEAYTRQGKHEQALGPMLALDVGNTTDLQLPQRISAIYKRLGKTEDAIRTLEHAARLDPYDTVLHQKLSALHLEAKNFPAAIRELQSNCDLQPATAEHFARLASVLKQAGRRDEALAAIRKAIAIEPDNTMFKQLLDSLQKPTVDAPAAPQ